MVKDNPGYSPTYLESPEEIREALAGLREKQALSKAQVQVATRSASAEQPVLKQEVLAFRPQIRPAVALLCILDDFSKDDGEWIRLRAERTVLGRTEGDVRIPCDVVMSSRHAELIRERNSAGVTRWTLVDLGSKNGTFIRVSSTTLKHQNEFVVGQTRYRFEMGNAEVLLETTVPEQQETGTMNWQGGSVKSLYPTLIEMKANGEQGLRLSLTKNEYWIGRDSSSCQIHQVSDPFLSPRHAKLYKAPNGHWHLENNKSINGIWLRIERLSIDRTCQFQLGEQRFLLKVPS